jgi:transposase InsO family protein
VPEKARAERAGRGTHPGHRRTQVAQSASRNPRFGCPRIARIVSQTFGIAIDKNVVYRVLSKHDRPAPGGTGPSWLSFIGHTTDSLWSVDLFRGESIVRRSYWVLVVMDQFTRRLVGIGVHGGAVTVADVCQMFNAAIHGQGVPRHLSTDHDPLFEAHRWTANLRIGRSTKSRPCRMCPCHTPAWSV